MFNKRINEVIEELSDAIYLLNENVKELKEEVAQYVKPSQGLSIHSIDYGKLARDTELMQRIIAKIQEIQQEQEDEAVLLMLM